MSAEVFTIEKSLSSDKPVDDKDLTLTTSVRDDGSDAGSQGVPPADDPRWLTGSKLLIVHSAMLLAFVHSHAILVFSTHLPAAPTVSCSLL
jgi:hypothetical protein